MSGSSRHPSWTVTADPSGYFRGGMFSITDLRLTVGRGNWIPGMEFTSDEGTVLRVVETRTGAQYLDDLSAPRKLPAADRLLHYLYSIDEIPDFATMAAACDIKPLQISTYIHTLVKEGWLEKHGRGWRGLWLTEKGQRRYDELRESKT